MINESVVLKPQQGPQEQFLSSEADIVIYGGAAGGGKTYALLLEPLRHLDNPKFGAVIFRRNANQIATTGGLWDTSMEMYPLLGAVPRTSPKYMFRFRSGMKVTFAHLETDRDVLSYQGAQIPLIGFDELTHFSEYIFFYMLSRNRSNSGVRGYIRATCNPDADSWVAKFISWWIDPKTGYPILERSGVVRYMVRVNGEVIWGNTKEELLVNDEIVLDDIKSVTFIPSKLTDNQILMNNDPSYLSNLKALPIVERERLLEGNWKIRPSAGLFFKRSQIGEILNEIPNDVIRWVRGWDLAATDVGEGGDPAYTSSVMMGKRRNGRYVIANVTNDRLKAAGVRSLIKTTAQIDKKKYRRCKIRLPQDPGQAGKDQAESMIKMLAGFSVAVRLESGSKETKAEPLAAQWQAGNFDLVEGEWNEAYLMQMEAFPEGKFKDMVDASSSAFDELEKINTSSTPRNSTNTKESYWKQ